MAISETAEAAEPVQHTARRRWLAAYADLAVCCLLGPLLLGLLAWNIPPLVAPRFVVGMLVGVAAPGYALTAALFPLKTDLDEVARWGLSLVLSAIVVIIVAWLLAVAGIFLDATSVTISLAGCILVASGVAAWRRHTLPYDALYVFQAPRGRVPYAVLALAIILGVTTWIIAGADLSMVQPSFALTSPSGQISGYPFQVAEGDRYPLRLQIHNPTGQTVSYRLEMTDGHGYARGQSIAVAARDRWSEAIILPSNPPARAETVRFQLRQQGKVVRELWVRYQIVPR